MLVIKREYFVVLILFGIFGYVFIILRIFTFPFETLPILEKHLIKTEGCEIPAAFPFSKIKVYKPLKNQSIICNNGTPPLFDSNETFVYILTTSIPKYGIRDLSALSCCYKVLYHLTGDLMKMSPSCTQIGTEAKMKDEYIHIICKYENYTVYTDFFSFIRIPHILKRKNIKHSPQFNVLVLGFDGLSRFRLQKQMPATIKMLQEIDGLEFMGYNDVANDSISKLIAILTGVSKQQFFEECQISKAKKLFSCPLIWNHFANNGYITAFGEDTITVETIFHNLHFVSKPTDYYWSPFNYVMETTIANLYENGLYKCAGARPKYKVFLNYIERFVTKLHRKTLPYFAFFWSSILSHDNVNQDSDWAALLGKLKRIDALDNTVLIFMSNHATPWGIRTSHKMMEEKLPFLFIALPNGFKRKYSFAYSNLVKNTAKLTTSFDLYRTLEDLSNYRKLTNWPMIFRIAHKRESYSLFEKISQKRTCRDALIPLRGCACQVSRTIPVPSFALYHAVDNVVSLFNRILQSQSKQCRRLYLSEIVSINSSSTISRNQLENVIKEYRIIFIIMPGHQHFGLVIKQYIDKTGVQRFRSGNPYYTRKFIYSNPEDCVKVGTWSPVSPDCYCKDSEVDFFL